MKILILVLYSETPVYRAMKTYLSKYYFNHPLVIQGLISVKFYSFNSISKPFVETDQEIIFQGKESLIPGILDKTIKAFEHFHSQDYDFVLRSNISTVVDISAVMNQLSAWSFDYCGSHIHTIKELLPKVGITNESFIGKTFVSGTAILFSRKAMNKMISNINHLLKKFGSGIIDDVALGLWMDELGFNAFQFSSLVNVDTITKGVLFYRNKRIVDNRAKDVTAISKLCDQLKSTSYSVDG